MVRRRVLAVRVLGPLVLALATGVVGLGPASAAPAEGSATVPAPVRQLLAEKHQPVAKHTSTAVRHALRLPGEDDEQAFVGFSPDCAVGKGKANLNAFVFSEVKLKLDYVLTGTAVRKTGTVKTKAERAVAIKLPSVRPGVYRLTVTRHGTTDLAADETIGVLPCVTVKASCRAVRFTNPASNPAAYITYSGHKKSQEFDLELAPGESRTVRADYAKIDYDVSSDDPDALTNALGDGTVKVKQKCAHGPARPTDNAVQTSGFAGCSTADQAATVTLGWSAQPSLTKRRYEVRDADQQVVAHGSFKGGHDSDLSLAAGTYTYRSYANRVVQPFEEVTFDVLGCVEVTPRCRALEVTNPNAASLLVIVFSPEGEQSDEDGGDEAEVTLPAHGTSTVPWTSPTAWVLALSETGQDTGSRFLSLASALTDDGEPPTTTVPQNC